MPDYVMLNGVEVLFIRQLYAVGIDNVASRLLEVLEFPPWYMSILATTTTTTSTTNARTSTRDGRRRRGEKEEEGWGMKMMMSLEEGDNSKVVQRSSTDNIRPIVAQFKIESEGDKFEDTVKKAFQRMRRKEGFEDIRGEIRREGDNVFIVFYFESEHLNEF